MTMFQTLSDLLGNRSEKKIAHMTKAVRLSAYEIAVTYHGTTIVVVNCDGSFLLNSNQQLSLTVKRRMNEYAQCKVYTVKGENFVDYDGKTVKYTDNMIIRVPKDKPAGLFLTGSYDGNLYSVYVQSINSIKIVVEMLRSLHWKNDCITTNQLIDLLLDERNPPDQVEFLRLYLDRYKECTYAPYIKHYMKYH